MSWIVSTKQYIPAVIGEAWGGGYFAGYISHTADGNPTHALIVAPRATGASGGSGGIFYTLTANYFWALNQNASDGINYSQNSIGATTPSAAKEYDGPSNMAILTAIGISNFPAAQFCKNLTIGGYTDWYVPARFELDIAYFNLKPTTATNSTSWGTNIYSVPQRNSNWTRTYPTQTPITAFNTTAEAFIAVDHWSSTEFAGNSNWLPTFTNGSQLNFGTKASFQCVRAFRKIAL